MKGRRKVRHHIINKVDGGSNNTANLLLMDEEKEKAFHKLFKNLTLEEAGNLLLRTARMKGGKK